MFNEVKNTQLYDVIVSQIKQEIENGGLKKGDKLPSEQDLANIFKVSRSTIREALTILRVEGIIETKKGIGTIILGLENKFSKINEDFFLYLVNKYNLKNDKKSLFEKALDLVKIRKLLEPYIYEEISKNPSKELLKELKNCINATRRRMKENLPYTVELTEFHYIAYKYLKNTILKEFMILVFEIQRLSRDLSLDFEESKELSVLEHEKIYEYIMKGDIKNIKLLVTKHLEKTEKLLLHHIIELDK